jgi:hypothetical protein
VLTKEELRELETQARSYASVQMTLKRSEKYTYKPIPSEEAEFIHWVKCFTGYDADKAHDKYVADMEAEEKRIYERELKTLTEKLENTKNGTESAWKLISEWFIPVLPTDDLTPLHRDFKEAWRYTWRDPATEKISPTAFEIVKELAPAIIDAKLANNDPNAYLRQLYEKYDGHEFTYKFDCGLDRWGNHRFYTIKFKIRCLHFPPQIKKVD